MSPYRSMLFVPGNDVKKVAKALASAADCVILDLEDAVAISEKAAARNVVAQILKDRGERPVYVRVNAMDTPYLYDDLTTIIPVEPTGIMLPKAESADQITCVDWLIAQLERQEGLPSGLIDMVPLIETAAGVDRATEIAGAGARLASLAFGAIDFTLDIGTSLSGSGQELLYARSRVVLACRLGERQRPIDTVFPDFRNEQGHRAECEVARCLGYQGKMIIHPCQIDVVHDVFSPSPDEMLQARRVVEAFAEAERRGLAAVNLDGKMIDYPVMKRSRQLLETRSVR